MRAVATSVERWQLIHQRLVSIRARKGALDAEEMLALCDAEREQIWKPLGMVSLIDYLERELGYSPRTGQERIRVARALRSLPHLAASLADATLHYSAVKELVRVVTPATEAAWRDSVRGMNLRQIEELVSGHRPGDLPTDPPDDQARTHTIRLEEVSAAAFASLRQARQLLDQEHDRRLTDDEFVALLAAAILRPTAANDEQAPHDGRAKHQIGYVVCKACDRMWQEAAGARIPVDAATREQVRCDAQHIGSLDASAPEPATQDIPPKTVRFVWRRDRGRCQTPGCRSTRNLEIHHIVRRADGGTHDPSNLTLRCGSCHRAHHEGQLTISGTAPDDLTTTRNVVTSVASAHHRPPPASSPTYAAVSRREEAILALRTSGWSRVVACRAVDEASAHVGADAGLADLLREAFRRCAN